MNDVINRLRGSFLKGLLTARLFIRDKAPIRSGNLRRGSDFTQPVLESNGFVSTLGINNSLMDKKYGEYVVFGTGLYGPYNTPVRPLKAKCLKFTIGNDTFFRRTVKGMKPNNYFKKGYDAGRSEIAKAIGQDARLLIHEQIHSARIPDAK